MRGRERPPVLDYLVFGTALVLAAIVGYYAVVRRPWSRPAPPPEAAAGASQPSVAQDEPASTLRGSGARDLATETPGMKAPGAAQPSRRRR